MKTIYVVIDKKTNEVIEECTTPKEASDVIIDRCNDDESCVVTDFDIREKEVQDPLEIVTSYEKACEYLGRDEHVGITTTGENPHTGAILAMFKLVTIAEAWNKIDGFVPDFTNRSQDKWFPYFYYEKESAGFVFAHANDAPSRTGANVGSRLCFKSSNRAREFGKSFIDLFNEFFLFK
jgi:hypothetical protein